jgi:hypothetical protein
MRAPKQTDDGHLEGFQPSEQSDLNERSTQLHSEKSLPSTMFPLRPKLVKFDPQTRFPQNLTMAFWTLAVQSAGHCSSDVAFVRKHEKTDVSGNDLLTNNQEIKEKFLGGSFDGCPATFHPHLQPFKVTKNGGGF